jgi:flagellin
MNVNLNTQYAVLRSSSNDLDRLLRVQAKSVSQLTTGSQAASADSPEASGSAVKLRNAGLRLRAVESGIAGAISYLEAQSDVFQSMASVLERISELASRIKDATKSADDKNAYYAEFLELREELSSYRTAQFNGRNLMDYISGAEREVLSVASSEDGVGSVNITQSDIDAFDSVNTLIGSITAETAPYPVESWFMTGYEDFENEGNLGQTGVQNAIRDLSNLMVVNQSEQTQLRLNLDRVREKIVSTEAAVSRVSDVDVAGELSVLARTDMQLRGAIATKTQSNVFADSALKLLSGQDFSTPLIQEARMGAPWTAAMLG